MDEQIGRILQSLKELGLEKETAVIFTSDHGYLLGEHHFWQKGNLREEVTRIPLIIRSPGKPSGISSSIVELVDLFPTACELTSLPIPDSVEGISLVPVLAKQDVQIKQSALSFVPNGTSLRTKKWSYMKYKNGDEELYDMLKDSKQFENLATNLEYKNQLSKVRKQYNRRISNVR